MPPDQFNAAFDEFRVSTFRLECLQTYTVSAEDARMRAFREGPVSHLANARRRD